MFDDGSTTNSTQGQAVDFVCRAKLRSTVADADVAENARVVFVVRSAVLGAVVVRRNAFNLSLTGWEVGCCVSKNDYTAPLTTRIVGNRAVKWVCLEREGDGARGGTVSIDLPTAGYDEGCSICTLTGHAFHNGTRFNGQCLSIVDEHISVEQVNVIACPSRRAGTVAIVRDDDFVAHVQ